MYFCKDKMLLFRNVSKFVSGVGSWGNALLMVLKEPMARCKVGAEKK